MKSLGLLALLALTNANQISSDLIQSSYCLINKPSTNMKCQTGYVSRANKCFISRYCISDDHCLNGDICYKNNCVKLQDQSPKVPISVDSCANVACNKLQKCVDGKCISAFPIQNDSEYCSVQICQQGYGCNSSEGTCYPLLDPYHDISYRPSKTTCRLKCQSGYLCKSKKCILDNKCKKDSECKTGEKCKNQKCQKQPTKVYSCSNVACNTMQKCVDGKCVQEIQIQNDLGYCSVKICQQGYGCAADGSCQPLLDPYHQWGYKPSKTTCRLKCPTDFTCISQKCVLNKKCKLDSECLSGYKCISGQCLKNSNYFFSVNNLVTGDNISNGNIVQGDNVLFSSTIQNSNK